MESGTYVLRVFLTKGCNLPPSPFVLGHGSIPLTRQFAFVSDGVF